MLNLARPVDRLHDTTRAAWCGALAIIFLVASGAMFAIAQASAINDLGSRDPSDSSGGWFVGGFFVGLVGVALAAITLFIVLSYADYRHRVLVWHELRDRVAAGDADASTPETERSI